MTPREISERSEISVRPHYLNSLSSLFSHPSYRKENALNTYLDLAKKATAVESPQTESPDDLKQHRLDKAARMGLIVRWSEYPDWIKLHDATTGEWHEVRAEECFPGVVETANKYRKKKGGAA
jgi:hypothetical protein